MMEYNLRDLSDAENSHWTPAWINSRWFSFSLYGWLL